ncbi:tight adherence pilus pseudopilin TadF [Celerinatantimonas sp. YJH-8]|uniref:tight adherence pilus pseudopilin TadF n=1 Tax=Celerinatantimonas sp. YJH-8 TaxID=3228714 RepID=UPI0038C3B3C7
MNVTNFTTKTQCRGVFTIELAIIAIFMSTILVFTSDVVIKQSIQGMLDRMSYSAVSVIKERTQLYTDADATSTSAFRTQSAQINQIVQKSLKRTMSHFDSARYAVVFERYHFENNDTQISKITYQAGDSVTCGSPVNLTLVKAKSLSPVTNEDRRADIYQVTVCYRTDNWYGRLVDQDYEWVRSNSIMIGR